MIAFTAKGVAATQLTHSHVVVLAEDPNSDGPRLEIMRGLSFSEQDRALGQDTYSLSTHTGATVYGGVESYALSHSTLTMRLDSRTSSILGIPREFSILLDTDQTTIEKVRSGLTLILGQSAD